MMCDSEVLIFNNLYLTLPKKANLKALIMSYHYDIYSSIVLGSSYYFDLNHMK